MAFNAIMAKKRRAVLLQYDEICDEKGWQVIIKVWKVPVSRTSPECMDYSLSLISPDGERVVRYDNHWPKGHHRHVLGEEGPYAYKDIETLIADFKADITKIRRKSHEGKESKYWYQKHGRCAARGRGNHEGCSCRKESQA